jgi:hypothetical protein
MTRLTAILIIIVSLASLGKAGEYGDAFILSAMYPRAQALGQSTVSQFNQNGHALTNPAGYSNHDSLYINLAYDQFNGLSNIIAMESGFPIGSNYRLGLNVIHSSVPDLFSRPDLSFLNPNVRRDSVLALAQQNGQIIRYREDAVFLSLAREFSFDLNLGWKFFKIPVRLPIGASVKYLDKLLVENRGLGIGFDLGGQFIFNLSGMSDILKNTEFAFGLMLHDMLNSPVYWETEHQDAIKRGIVRGVGVSQHFDRYGLDIRFSTSIQDRYPEKRQLGLEVGLKNRLFVRLGSDGYTPSFGLGIGLKKFIIDYTFSRHELAGMQKIGINYHF